MSSNITLSLDTEALREATMQAMVGVLTPEAKEKILQNAVRSILEPSTNSWDRGNSPLQMAFNQAILAVAREESVRLIREDAALRSEIMKLLKATATKVLAADPDKLATKMADSFIDSVRQD